MHSGSTKVVQCNWWIVLLWGIYYITALGLLPSQLPPFLVFQLLYNTVGLTRRTARKPGELNVSVVWAGMHGAWWIEYTPRGPARHFFPLCGLSRHRGHLKLLIAPSRWANIVWLTSRNPESDMIDKFKIESLNGNYNAAGLLTILCKSIANTNAYTSWKMYWQYFYEYLH